MPDDPKLKDLYSQIKQLEQEANFLDMKGEYIKSREKTNMRDLLQAQYTSLEQQLLRQKTK